MYEHLTEAVLPFWLDGCKEIDTEPRWKSEKGFAGRRIWRITTTC